MLNFGRAISQSRTNRSVSFRRHGVPRSQEEEQQILLAATVTALCIIMLKQSPSFNTTSSFSLREAGVTHVLVTGGAGYIGSHAALRLLRDQYLVTIVDNLSRGNLGAVKVLQELFPESGRLQFICTDLGDPKSVSL